MTKRCICEICTCGRHRCPHRPTNHLGQGAGPCQLTEYTNVYKPHPLQARETFKPAAAPMQGGQFEDKTTQRTDFHAHPIERPQFHQPDQYVAPTGNMDTNTSYKQEYTEKYGMPARAIRNDGQRMVPGKFEGLPTYKSDYRKWDAAGRPQAYGQQAAWKPSEARFEGQTTFQNDYKSKEIQLRQSFKPNDAAKMSDTPFDSSTSHRDAFIQHAMPPRFVHPKEEYKASGALFDGTTTFKRDYRGQPGEPIHSFKPDGKPFQSTARFEDGTTNRHDFKKWPMERPFVHAQEQYHAPQGRMETDTTHNATYTQMPIERVVARRPTSVKKSNAAFDGTTNYSQDYRKWDGQRTMGIKQPDYVPNNLPFEGLSTYKGHYQPHATDRTRAIRPDQAAFRSDAKFEDSTMYRQDYVPKPINICEVEYINQPTSRFRFAEEDTKGHKFYEASVTPLQVNGPTHSQQRLQMSVA